MQAVGRFMELHLPDMAETEAGLVIDAKGYYGPIAKILSMGEEAKTMTSAREGDWIVFNSDIIISYRVKGTIRNFMVADGIVATITNAEVDAPVKPPSKILTGPKLVAPTGEKLN